MINRTILEIVKKIIMETLEDDDVIRVISNKILRDLEDIGYFKSRYKSELIAGGIMYLAYIKAGNPKSIDDIANMIPDNIYERKFLNNEIKMIKKALGMKYCKTQTIMGTACIVLTTPEQYFVEMCKKENISQNIIDTGVKILKQRIQDNPIFQSCNPANVGGTILYIASILEGKKITQRTVADMMNSNEVTVRNVARKIFDTDKKLAEKFKRIKKTLRFQEGEGDD